MFLKNLESLNNIELQTKLSQIPDEKIFTDFGLCPAKSGDYILVKNNIPLENIENPILSIKNALNATIKNEMSPNDIVIIFGLGLGYILDEAFNKFPCRIFVYEPDTSLIKFVLNCADCTKYFNSKRVFITDNEDDFFKKLDATFLPKDKVEVGYLPQYAALKSQELLTFSQRIFETCRNKMIDVNTIKRFSSKWLINILENLKFIKNNETFPLASLQNQFSGQTALILAAGPSLAENIHNVKNNREKFVILAVNKVAKYLIENDIIPDFVLFLDASYIAKTIVGIEDKFKDTICLMDIKTDHTVLNNKFKKIFFNFSDTDSVMQKLVASNKHLEILNIGGSVSTFALTTAVKLGFSKIILSGIDLAIKDDKVYSSGETITKISDSKVLVGKSPKNLVKVESVLGTLIDSREDYAAFISHFESLIKQLGHKEIYNTTTFGANIKGTHNIQFKDLKLPTNKSLSALENIKPLKINLDSFIQEELTKIQQLESTINSTGFSQALIPQLSSSVLLYQYLQKHIMELLQNNFEIDPNNNFIEKLKLAIAKIYTLIDNI